MSKTTDNLKEAFAGESQANRKYLAFAKKADDEGLPQVAKLFRAAAAAETIHAHAHLRQMNNAPAFWHTVAALVADYGRPPRRPRRAGGKGGST